MLNNQNISFYKERVFLALFLPKLNNSGQSLISALYYGRDLIKWDIIVSVGRSGILGVVRVFGWTPHFTFYEIWQIDTRERIARRRRRKKHHFAKPCRPRLSSKAALKKVRLFLFSSGFLVENICARQTPTIILLLFLTGKRPGFI